MQAKHSCIRLVPDCNRPGNKERMVFTLGKGVPGKKRKLHNPGIVAGGPGQRKAGPPPFRRARFVVSAASLNPGRVRRLAEASHQRHHGLALSIGLR